MQIYLAATPDKLRTALGCTSRLAHVAYRIGSGGQLTCSGLPPGTWGGLMALNDRDCGPIRDREGLCRAIFRTCSSRRFAGVLADFEEPFSREKASLLQALCPLLRQSGRQLFVPEPYGESVPGACVLLCTAISGGTLRQRLEEGVARFGRERTALDLQRLRMDFPLPCPGGQGDPLTAQALQALLDRKPAIFYSADLCARYFTITRESRRRFILFDDAGTLLQKIHLGNSLGISTGFLMLPEVEDILPQLFPR